MTALSIAVPSHPETLVAQQEVVAAERYLVLRILAETYADLQEQRIRVHNRVERGGVDPDAFIGTLGLLDTTENGARLSMLRAYRRLVRSELPGVDAWQKSEFGIGEHLLARLLGHLGHPRFATPYHWEGDGENRALVPDPPFERRVSDLWSFCGHGDPTRRRRKGMTADEAFGLGNPKLKMLVHLLAEASMKCKPTDVIPITAAGSSVCADLDPAQSSVEAQRASGGASLSLDRVRVGTPSASVEQLLSDEPSALTIPTKGSARRTYRSVYDQRRAVTQHRDDWTLGHKHNDALRIVGKTILRDLWLASA